MSAGPSSPATAAPAPTAPVPTAQQPAEDSPLTSSVSTTNACRMCMPLGAALAFAGLDRTVPFLHGSQGCATYIRRYLISHFNEPMDIASSSVGEAATVFGGEANLRTGIANVTSVYRPSLIGVATTCLVETIGEDVPAMLRRIEADREPAPEGAEEAQAADGAAGTEEVHPPVLINASTPSYAGTHADGYHAAVAAAVGQIAQPGETTDRITLLPGILSPADLRHLHEIVGGFEVPATMVPDYSDRLDGATAARYDRLPEGGTSLDAIAGAGSSRAAITLGGLVTPGTDLAGDVLATTFGVEHHRLPMPIGIRLTDRFVDLLGDLSGRPAPAWLSDERGRLIDAYVDGHKYLAEATAVVYGDEDLVLALAVFLAEIGITPAVCATGGRSGRLARDLAQYAPELDGAVQVIEDVDFHKIGILSRRNPPDLFIGHSKGYSIARELGVPLVRVGLPIHDRIGGQRLQHVGYRGTQQLFDRLCNTIIQRRQDESPVGYSYM